MHQKQGNVVLFRSSLLIAILCVMLLMACTSVASLPMDDQIHAGNLTTFGAVKEALTADNTTVSSSSSSSSSDQSSSYTMPLLAPLPTAPKIVVTILLLLIFFQCLNLLSDTYLTETLQIASEAMKLSPQVAGLTLLSFANGAPDFFTALAGLNQSPENATLVVASIVGGGLFVTMTVLGSVVLASFIYHAEETKLKAQQKENQKDNQTESLLGKASEALEKHLNENPVSLTPPPQQQLLSPGLPELKALSRAQTINLAPIAQSTELVSHAVTRRRTFTADFIRAKHRMDAISKLWHVYDTHDNPNEPIVIEVKNDDASKISGSKRASSIQLSVLPTTTPVFHGYLLPRRAYIRNVLIYTIAITILFCSTLDGKIETWEASLLVSVYICFIFSFLVVYLVKLYKQRKVPQLHIDLELEGNGEKDSERRSLASLGPADEPVNRTTNFQLEIVHAPRVTLEWIWKHVILESDHLAFCFRFITFQKQQNISPLARMQSICSFLFNLIFLPFSLFIRWTLPPLLVEMLPMEQETVDFKDDEESENVLNERVSSAQRSRNDDTMFSFELNTFDQQPSVLVQPPESEHLAPSSLQLQRNTLDDQALFLTVPEKAVTRSLRRSISMTGRPLSLAPSLDPGASSINVPRLPVPAPSHFSMSLVREPVTKKWNKTWVQIMEALIVISEERLYRYRIHWCLCPWAVIPFAMSVLGFTNDFSWIYIYVSVATVWSAVAFWTTTHLLTTAHFLKQHQNDWMQITLPNDILNQCRSVHITFLITTVISFLMCITWIYTVAGEIIAILQYFSDISGMDHSVLGLTVLAWGNSLGDLFSNAAMAKAGHFKVSITAVFTGPIQNALLTAGCVFLAQCLRGNGAVMLGTLNDVTILGFGCLFFTLIVMCGFVVVIHLQWRMSRAFGLSLIILYGAITLAAFLMQIGKKSTTDLSS